MTLRTLFVSSQDGRLRAGWRIAFFVALHFSLIFLLYLPVAALAGQAILESGTRSMLVAGMVNAVSVGLAAWVSRRTLDRKSVESLGFPPERLWQDMGAGILIGGLMISAAAAVALLAGWVSFEGFRWEQVGEPAWGLDVLNMFLLFLLTGITEELQFRGYIMQNIEEGLGTRWAVLLSSAIFALLHFANPGASQAAPLLGLYLAGIFFAFAYLRTRTLWLATGLHIGWNVFINTVFGFPVSGIDTPGLLVPRVSGPEIWTGGSFGPEAGLLLLPALAVGVALVLLAARKR